jgi:hypothetical protein
MVMSTFIIVFIAMLGILLLMAVGVVFANKPIKGSCGGMSTLGMDSACDICGGNPSECEKEQRVVSEQDGPQPLYQDAMTQTKS